MNLTFAVLALVALAIALVWLIALLGAEIREDRQAYLATVSERERIARRDRNRNEQPSLTVHSAAASRQPKYPKSLNDRGSTGRSQGNGSSRRLRGTDERGRDGR